MTLAILLTGCLGLDPMGVGPGDDSGVPTNDTATQPSTFGGMSFPESVDFGQIMLDSSPGSADITLTNDSQSNVKITEIQLDAGSDFEAEYTSVPWVIGSGGQYVVTVSFDPSTAGVQTGALTFGVETESGLASVTLTGEGIGEDTGTGTGTSDGGGGDGGDGGGTTGILSYSSTSVDFGGVDVGSSDSSSITITNGTAGPVDLVSISSSSAVFSTTGISTPATLDSGTSSTLQIAFQPTAVTTYGETITVQTNLGNQVIDVTGSGQTACSICSPVIDVDTGGLSTEMDFVSVFDIADTQTVRISNVGDEDLVVRDVSVTNDRIGGGTFSVGWSGSTTVVAGSSVSVSVSYTCPDICLDLPNDVLDWNILHIESNDPTNPDWTVALSGV